MSRDRRLARLESAGTGVTADRGSYCRDCGGLSIEDVAHLMQDDPEDRPEVDGALTRGTDRCVRCGELTLIGTLAQESVG